MRLKLRISLQTKGKAGGNHTSNGDGVTERKGRGAAIRQRKMSSLFSGMKFKDTLRPISPNKS